MTEPYHLVPHPPGACAGVGEAGERSAAQLLADARAVAATLPESERESEILVMCRGRYHFAVGLLAAWQRGHSVALPPTDNPRPCAHWRTGARRH
jgi:acyl-CoA synthetase (AMP-forming)/AMP-acid ligase II